MDDPSKHLSSDEAMILFGGDSCPIIRASPRAREVVRGCFFIDTASLVHVAVSNG